ncbi:hypothetical protein CSM90_004955, partial [Salmonella enterica subsp. diarizonae]|nr:hypothetical protein [Salmonella enterica subsp. diarizonae]
ALGRKYLLFAGSDESGEPAAILYLLIESCRGIRIYQLLYLLIATCGGELSRNSASVASVGIPDNYFSFLTGYETAYMRSEVKLILHLLATRDNALSTLYGAQY